MDASFSSSQPLIDLIRSHKNGSPMGIYSVCSANPWVIEACMQQAASDGSHLLIESTCNQVNQFGGYTGLTPADFVQLIAGIVRKMQFPLQRVILGGDHLGPNPWQKLQSKTAMEHSLQLVREYISAGYVKIHLDTSMVCADDRPAPLAGELIARRTAYLCAAAEAAAPAGSPPVYIIGTEVPVPGGEPAGSARPQVTRVEDARNTIELFRQTFIDQGLESAWQRVIGLVVEPGVGFGSAEIYEYDRNQTAPLSSMIEYTSGIVFEAHSTDYQTPEHLRQLVADHFAILKVGPGLTFAMREAIFALAFIEEELLGDSSSKLIDTAQQVMLQQPEHWQAYYTGSAAEMAFARKYSLSDRIRYYWSHPRLNSSLNQMLQNLSITNIPFSLISQYFPDLVRQVRQGQIPNEPAALIHARIRTALSAYAEACQGNKEP
jgi:D-tagatose-1,6-bisphosphate aldolase subunit GatZ/KbaZ